MLVSVIIPCYNYGNFLPEAVRSVQMQTHQHWECLIINDGSTDNTHNIGIELQKTDNRIRYLHKPNGGLSSARNFGINLSKGDLICFLDADDLLDERKFEEQIQGFLKNPQADIVYGNAMFFEKNDLTKLYESKIKKGSSELSVYSGKGDELVKLLVKMNLTVVSTPLIKKTVFEQVGNFDESYKSYEDWHFWLRCALAGCEFMYWKQPPVSTYIRFGHESMMSDKRKLILAGVQLRTFMASQLPLPFRLYNYYRLLKLRIKLLLL